MITEPNYELADRLRQSIAAHDSCGGSGWASPGVYCSCRLEAIYQIRLFQCGIPPRILPKSFIDFENKKNVAYKKIMEYLDNVKEHYAKGEGVYIYATAVLPTGKSEKAGKTLLACSLLKELMKKNYECKYVRFTELMNTVTEEETKKFLNEVNNWNFLCIDDVSIVLDKLTNFRQGLITGNPVNGAVDLLSSILVKRSNALKPTILTGVATIRKLEENFPSLANIISGDCIVVCCDDTERGKRKEDQQADD